ncbi:MAG: LacI family DNA-binding transcriptional regulator [Chloroflexi bacterium]|nr:LacI family DNA-binding transcriptional regulator [Chloroflexota bacterium]
MNLNLEDIARLSGVSRSTVSRVINNHPNVREATKEKVMRVIREQNFHPNPVARMLATQRAQIIGIVVSQTATTFFNDTSSYFPTIIQGIADTTNERNYGTLLWLNNGSDSENEENFYRRIIHNRLMDGVIVISGSSSRILVDHLAETNIPFVCIERPHGVADRTTYVSINNVEGAKQAIRHLVSLGRRRIGVVMGPPENTDATDRLAGYYEAMQEAGLEVDPAWVFVGQFTTETGLQGARALLSQRVDAIFAGSDQIAIGLLQAFHEEGVRVPEDVAIVGFDDLPSAVEVTPQLTTVHHPIREKGAVATRLLLEQIEGRSVEPQHIFLPTHLVIRQSCGAARVQNSVQAQVQEV